MKIAIVSPDDLSILILFKGLINALYEENDHTIITISPGEHYVSAVKELGVQHISVSMDRYINPVNDLKYLWSLYKIFKKHRFDIVLNFTAKPIIYGTISARLAFNNGVVCAFRGLGTIFQPDLNFRDRFLQKLVMGLFVVACRLSRKVWFTNESDLEYFVFKGIVQREKIILTNNGINIEYFLPDAVHQGKMHALAKEFGISNKHKVVIMVGRMIWPKGIREFVEASKILSKTYPFLKFILVGPLEDENPQSVPEAYLRECEKAANFQWVGFRDDVRELYALSDLAVLPSYYKEGGFPRALLEPMALGKPVIAADTPDCRGPVDEGKNGLLVPGKDPKALANAIDELIKSEKKREMFGRYSRIKVEKEFDEKVIFKNVIKEFQNLL